MGLVLTLPAAAQPRLTLEHLGIEQTKLPQTEAENLRSLIRSGKYEAIRAKLLELMGRYPADPTLFLVMARAAYSFQSFADSIEAMENARRKSVVVGEDDEFVLAMAHFGSGNAEPAIMALEALAGRSPANATYPYWLGRVYMALHKPAQSTEFLRRTIQLDPQFVDAYLRLGEVFHAQGTNEEAVKAYEQAVMANRRSRRPTPEAPLRAATLLQDMDKFDQAAKYIEEAFRMDPKFPPAQFWMGFVRERSNDKDRAIFHYREAIRLNAKYKEAYFALGRVLNRAGNASEAKEVLATFQKLEQEGQSATQRRAEQRTQ